MSKKQKRYVKNAGVEMGVKVTPPASVGLLSMGRQMLDRATNKQTHSTEYDKAELEAGVDWELVGNRIYLLAITTGTTNAQIRVEVSFDGVVMFDQTTSQGADATVARFRVTTRPEA